MNAYECIHNHGPYHQPYLSRVSNIWVRSVGYGITRRIDSKYCERVGTFPRESKKEKTSALLRILPLSTPTPMLTSHADDRYPRVTKCIFICLWNPKRRLCTPSSLSGCVVDVLTVLHPPIPSSSSALYAVPVIDGVTEPIPGREWLFDPSSKYPIDTEWSVQNGRALKL